MKKLGLILLAALVFFGCEKDPDNHYTVRRLTSVEESNADGSVNRISRYSYYDDYYLVTTTLNGALESVSRLSSEGNRDIQVDSTVVEGVLQHKQTITAYYSDSYRARLDSVVTVDPAGVELLRDVYSHDSSFTTVFGYEAGQKKSMKVYYSSTYSVSVSVYSYNTEADDWKYEYKEETATTYDDDLTIITTIHNGQPSEKTIYQSLGARVEFRTYKAAGESSWSLVASGAYIYETITL